MKVKLFQDILQCDLILPSDTLLFFAPLSVYDGYVGIDTLTSVVDCTVYVDVVICASQVSFVDVSMLTVVVVRGEWGLFIVSL